MNFTSFLMFASSACPLARRKRNNSLPNLIPYSSLYWNPGSPTCLALCYSQRHKKAYSQGQPRPTPLKFLKSENLNITPPTTVNVSLHLTETYKSHTYIQVFWCHLFKGEKKWSGKCFLLLTGWSKEKSRVLCIAFPWSFLNWINNWTVQDVSGEDTDPMAPDDLESSSRGPTLHLLSDSLLSSQTIKSCMNSLSLSESKASDIFSHSPWRKSIYKT